MLNSQTGARELAYVCQVLKIEPMVGYDNLELATINGWTCVVGKNDFHVGDFGIYFEIDSKLPEVEPFTNSAAIVKYHFKIKTQKFGRGGIKYISQGLLMHPREFGWKEIKEENKETYLIGERNKQFYLGDFLTQTLGITYYEPEDNARKAKPADKYKLMCARHQNLFKKYKFFRWLYSKIWGKKLLFIFLGKKRDKRQSWPAWVSKTDEERVQNQPWRFPGDDTEWIATEKIDGSSSTFTMRQAKPKKRKLLVCSRNVVFDKPDEKCFYETNIYTEMAEKYDIERVLNYILDTYLNLEFITIQGEIYGGNIQKRKYGDEHKLAIFNIITKFKDKEPTRYNPVHMHEFIDSINNKLGTHLEGVPVINEHFKLPETCEELLEIANGKSVIDGGMREGLVFRSQDGSDSFKAVSNDFLLKYHS